MLSPITAPSELVTGGSDTTLNCSFIAVFGNWAFIIDPALGTVGLSKKVLYLTISRNIHHTELTSSSLTSV